MRHLSLPLISLSKDSDGEVTTNGEAATSAIREILDMVVVFKSLHTYDGTLVFFHSFNKCAAFNINRCLYSSLTRFFLCLYLSAAVRTSQAVS